ncbi:DUF6328 family protein [Streptomyces sp. MRC013]|uniref:DUF6328 family protein n=1 Tax=Streptomyces sp. MRC013 TaxID=2898276 RepID=UPI00202619CC|nr:DUF6328 family protein [Streptomyces sp. MRC013]URM88799.1 DUF6328 family protein [Streptomyces sp. MRC013]
MPGREHGASKGADGAHGPSGAEERGNEQWRGRRETPEEQADRRWTELLQEIRVAQTGVQILFGFLLTVVFAPRFADLSDVNRAIYITTVVLGAGATGALIGPVSLHRLVSGRRIKPQTVVWASRMTFTGLVLLLATMVSALFLVLRVATHDGYVPWLVSGVALWYLLWWFVLPLWARHRYTTRD